MPYPGLDFRRCDDCGARHPRGEPVCASCGRDAFQLPDLLRDRRFYAVGLLALAATLLAVAIPPGALSPLLTLGQQTVLEELVMTLAVLPLLLFLGWVGWRRRRRDAAAYVARIDEVETQVAGLQSDVMATERRLSAARRDRGRLDEGGAARELEHEIAQDQRLRQAQRRLVAELAGRAEQLRVERWRRELVFYEACRDSRVEAPELAAELANRIEELEDDLGRRNAPRDLWGPVLDDSWSLQRSLSRGVPRLLAAARLDPLARVDLVQAPPASASAGGESLDDELERHLDRIERDFDALEELEDEMRDTDASGVRVRVDDEVITAYEEELQARREERAQGRTSDHG
ncbi:MAG: hypothetical protein ACFCGT_17255 [Sandaracinaceae bacterium]